jgi:hypothetical protein
MRMKGKFTANVPCSGDKRLADIRLTIITSNSGSTNPSEISFAEVNRRLFVSK